MASRRVRAGTLALVLIAVALLAGSVTAIRSMRRPAAHSARAAAAASDPQPSTSEPEELAPGDAGSQALVDPAPADVATAPPSSVAAATRTTQPAASRSRKLSSPSPKPVGVPAPSGPPGGNPTSFKFTSVDALGRPARWDPCVEIRWAFNPDQAPPGGLELVRGALERLSQASGLRFTSTGTTSFKPLKQPEGAYPSGTDAVVAFAGADEYPEFSGGTYGFGGFTSMVSPEGSRIVRGGVVLNARLVRSIPDGFGSGQRRGGAVLHELGHMVGLDHVSDTGQLMNSALTTSAPPDYAAGDRNGLSKVGAPAGCFVVPRPPEPVAPVVPTNHAVAPVRVL